MRRESSGCLVCAVAVLAIILPNVVSAQVVISEIAWMGSAGNANAEWIELHNTGSSLVSLEEWTVTAQDGSPSIVLSGTVAAGAFFLLERTTDDTVPGIAAGAVYVGSLSNSGETLMLKNAGGTIVDTVVGGENWQGIGGDNVTKQTAQKTTNGWTTATPTPGAENAGGSSGDSNTDDSGAATSTDQSTGAGNTSADSILGPPPKVFADGGSDRTVVVGADTEFRARAFDEKKNVIDFSRFHWNFGDGTTADTAVTMHRFEYPGRYVVVLAIPEEKDSVADQIIVTVERVELALSLMEDGGVVIENRAGRTLDLSRWIIRSPGRTFTLPARTFILAGSSLRISQRTLGFSSSADVELAYPSGASALGIVPIPVVSAASSTSTPVATKYSSQTAVFEKVDDYTAAREVESSSVEQSDIATATEEPIPAQAAGVGSALSGSSRVWWFGVIGIAGLAAGSLALARRYGKKEWDIIEESDGAV